MQSDRVQHQEMGQGPHRRDENPARLHIVSLCSDEAILLTPNRGILVQETDFHGGRNTMVVTMLVSERALTSQHLTLAASLPRLFMKETVLLVQRV